MLASSCMRLLTETLPFQKESLWRVSYMYSSKAAKLPSVVRPIDVASSMDCGFCAQIRQPRMAMLFNVTCSTPLTDACKQAVSLLLVLVAQLLQPLVMHCLHDIPPVIQLAYLCCMPCCLLLQLPYLPACNRHCFILCEQTTGTGLPAADY